MVTLILSKTNSHAQKKALKIEVVMEEHPHIIERFHLYIQPSSPCKDRDEYILEGLPSVLYLQVSRRFNFSPTFNPGHVLYPICVEYRGGLSQ